LPHSTQWDDNGVVWKYWGIVTGDELLESNQEIYGDARFDAMKYQVVDLTAVERFDVNEDDMMVVAANDKAAARSNPNVRVAIVASDSTILQLSRIYGAATAATWKQRFFETTAAARSWASAERRYA
jgi:hypothetical protein